MPESTGHKELSESVFAKARLSTSFEVQQQKVLRNVPVRKPKDDWFRTHAEWEEWFYDTFLLEEDRGLDRQTYLVDPELIQDLINLLPRRKAPKSKRLYPCLNSRGAVFLWAVRLPFEGEDLDSWSRSAHDLAQLARKQWVFADSNIAEGYYEAFKPTQTLRDKAAVWPSDVDLHKLFDLAFKSNYIADLNHPVVERMLGAED